MLRDGGFLGDRGMADKICRVEDGETGEVCGQPVIARGYCRRHYQEWRKAEHARLGKVCQVIENGQVCGGVVFSRGVCQKHYMKSWSSENQKKQGGDVRLESARVRKVCQVEELGEICGKDAVAGGMCWKHYVRVRRHGDVMFGVQSEEEFREWFFGQGVSVEDGSGCVLWDGDVDYAGYGVVRYEGKMWRVNRLMWKMTHEGFDFDSLDRLMYVNQTCKKRLCINPEHLYLDSISDGHVRGEQCHSVKLAERDVVLIRKMIDKKMDRKEIASLFGITVGQVAHIKTGRTWSHVK